MKELFLLARWLMTTFLPYTVKVLACEMVKRR